MKLIKAFVSFCMAVMALLLMCETHAQVYTVNTLAVTNQVAASTTITPNAAIPLAGRYDQLSIQASYNSQNNAAATNGVSFAIQRSLDNVNWEGSAYQTLTVNANGTNTVTGILDFTYGAAGYLRLNSLVNSNGYALSNIVIKVATKPRPYNK